MEETEVDTAGGGYAEIEHDGVRQNADKTERDTQLSRRPAVVFAPEQAKPRGQSGSHVKNGGR